LNLTIAHQYIEQMEEEVRAAVFGNVGTMVTFRVGAYDAEVLEKEFAPTFTAEDLVNLGSYQIYLKLMIDGVSSSPFSALTMAPITKSVMSWRDDVIASSRKSFAKSRDVVEAEVKLWHEPIKPPEIKRDEKKAQIQPTATYSSQQSDGHRPVPRPAIIPPKPIKQEPQKNEFAKAFESAGVVPAKFEAKPRIEQRSDFRQKDASQPASLKNQNQNIRKGDEHRTENMSALRSALSQVLKSEPKKETPIPETIKVPRVPEQQNSSQNQQKQVSEAPKEKTNSNEVSSEVLKAVLHGGNPPKI